MKNYAIWFLFIIPFCLYADNITDNGKIQSVVLYRGQALVTRSVDLEVQKGQHQLVISQLPSAIQSTTLFANASSDISVRSVRYRTRVTEKSPVEAVQKYNEKIQKIEKQIREAKNKQNLIYSQEQYLAGLKSYVISTTKLELNQASLDPKSLTSMMTYIFSETKRLNSEKFQLDEALLDLKSKLIVVRDKKRELAGKDVKDIRQAVVFFEKKTDLKKSKIDLNYLVNNATWTSTYNVHTQNSQDKLTIEYNALVQQTSGEDWSNVQLTLSTASIEMSAEAPTLARMAVKLQSSSGGYSGTHIAENYRQLKSEQESLLKSRSKMNRSQQTQANTTLNQLSNNIQLLEFASSSSGARGRRMRLHSALTVNYEIPGEVSIASRADQQMVEIKKLKLDRQLYNVTIPLLSEYIYRKAKITNSYEIALLEGKANVYLDGHFVGSAFIPMTAKGQKFTLGLGVDTQVRASRELLSHKQYVQRGNKAITLKYRMSFDNFKEKPVSVRVFDRVPKNDELLSVVVTSETPLSKDTRYQKTAKTSGILRWDIQIPEEMKLQTPYTIEYKVQLEFDKGMNIVIPGQTPLPPKAMENLKNIDAGYEMEEDYAEESLDDGDFEENMEDEEDF